MNKCERCNGTGTVHFHAGWGYEQDECPECEGTGVDVFSVDALEQHAGFDPDVDPLNFEELTNCVDAFVASLEA
jgi:RecJ-like exonuclease